jgi:hypothetical protein
MIKVFYGKNAIRSCRYLRYATLSIELPQRSSGTVYCAKIVSSDPHPLSKVEAEMADITGNVTSLPPLSAGVPRQRPHSVGIQERAFSRR